MHGLLSFVANQVLEQISARRLRNDDEDENAGTKPDLSQKTQPRRTGRCAWE